MNDNPALLEPINLYEHGLKTEHNNNVINFFDSLTKESNIDVAANQATCKEYYQKGALLSESEKKLGANKGLRVFLIIMTILCFAIGTIYVVCGILNVVGSFKPYAFVLGFSLIVFGIGFIILNSVIIARKIAKYNKNILDLRRITEKLHKDAEEQMVPLNSLFEWNIPSILMNKTLPEIELDKNYSVKRLLHLSERFGMKREEVDNVSTVFVQSGSIIDNSFIIQRDYVQDMRDKVYQGSLVVTWTTTVSDGKGGHRVVTHSQTLIATVTKPEPYYYLDTNLVYGNDAAPHLSFTRKKGNTNQMSQKEIDKLADVWDKKLQKMQQSKVKSSFTPIGNSKFEGLFQAFDRNNEVEFRVLFTPLAQLNMIKLLTSKKPYGDDFDFIKRKCMNIIHSDHMQHLSIDGNPYHFYDFDYDKCREKFIAYNNNYFRGIFYDFAPLLSIPVYQQHRDFTPKNFNYQSNMTMQEAEVLANFFDEDLLAPEDAETHIILNASILHKGKGYDIVTITANGFSKEHHTDMIPKVAGNGRTYLVPVHWIEYIPTSRERNMVIMEVGGSTTEFNQKVEQIKQLSGTGDIIYQRGLLAFLLNDGVESFDGGQILKLFSR